MVACGHDLGTSILKLIAGNEKQCKWMRSGNQRFYKMYGSPRAEGQTNVVKFHPVHGRILVTGSKSALLSLFGYDNNRMNFVAMDSHQLEGTISSIAWRPDGRYLVACLQPSSKVVLFSLIWFEEGKSVKLKLCGEAFCPSSPKDSKIHALFGPHDNLFTTSDEAEHITIWHLESNTWRALYKVKCGTGVLSLSMIYVDWWDFLVALNDDDTMKLWKIDTASSHAILIYDAKLNVGHSNMMFEHSEPAGSRATAIDTSRPYLIITAGVNESRTMSTIVLQRKSTHMEPSWTGCLTMDSFPHERGLKMNSIKFNPDPEQAEISLVTGGDGGFLHFWAMTKEPQLGPAISFEDEHYFYDGKNGKPMKRNAQYEKLLPEDTDHDYFGLGGEPTNDFKKLPTGLDLKIEAADDVPLQDDYTQVMHPSGTGAAAGRGRARGRGRGRARGRGRGRGNQSDDDYDPSKEADQGESDKEETPLHPETQTIHVLLDRKFEAIRTQENDRKSDHLARVDTLCFELKTEVDSCCDKLKSQVDVFGEELKTLFKDSQYESLCEYACQKVEDLKKAIDDAEVEGRRMSGTLSKEEHMGVLEALAERATTTSRARVR